MLTQSWKFLKGAGKVIGVGITTNNSLQVVVTHQFAEFARHTEPTLYAHHASGVSQIGRTGSKPKNSARIAWLSCVTMRCLRLAIHHLRNVTNSQGGTHMKDLPTIPDYGLSEAENLRLWICFRVDDLEFLDRPLTAEELDRLRMMRQAALAHGWSWLVRRIERVEAQG